MVPGPVQNLRQTLDTNQPSLTLNWDKPKNSNFSGEVTVYDVYFRPFRCPSEQPSTTATPMKKVQQQPSTWSVDKVLTPTNSPDTSIDTSPTSQWDCLQQDLSSFHPHSLSLHSPEGYSEIVKRRSFQQEHSHSGGESMPNVGGQKCTATSGNYMYDNYLKSWGPQLPPAPSIPPPMFHEKTPDAPPTSTLPTEKPPTVYGFDPILTSHHTISEPFFLHPGSSPGQPLLSHPIPLSTSPFHTYPPSPTPTSPHSPHTRSCHVT